MKARILALALAPLAALSAAPTRAAGLDDVWVVALPKAEAASDLDRERARKAFARAQEAYAKGQNAKALEAMEYAYKTVPNASTAMTRAFILGELGRHQQALEGYLVAANLDPTPDERRTIDEGFKKHGQVLGVGVVQVAVIPHDARVTIDGRGLEGRTFVAVKPGEHLVRAEADGHQAAEVPVSIAAGSLAAIDRTLERLGALEVRKPEVKPTTQHTPDGSALVEAGDPGPGVAEWIFTASGVGVVVAGGVLLDQAVRKHKETSERAKNGTIDESAYKSAGTEIDGFWGAGWVLVGAGAAALAVGIILFALPDDAAPIGGPQVQAAAPLVWPDGGGFAVHGKF